MQAAFNRFMNHKVYCVGFFFFDREQNCLTSSILSLGTRLHWSQTMSGDTLAVEISSYVLLAVLTVQPLTMANLGYANRIVNWLVAQQNPYGGFSSTQVTPTTKHEHNPGLIY